MVRTTTSAAMVTAARRALWICRCAWTTLARRPQLHRANNSKTRWRFDEEEERPSPYQPTPMVPTRVHCSATGKTTRCGDRWMDVVFWLAIILYSLFEVIGF